MKNDPSGSMHDLIAHNYFLFLFMLVIWTQTMSFRQTCKLRVSGRNMRYQRALQIVQDEEYLSVIDLDDIRHYRRKTKKYKIGGILDLNPDKGILSLVQIFKKLTYSRFVNIRKNWLCYDKYIQSQTLEIFELLDIL